jgi:hypothetical protein
MDAEKRFGSIGIIGGRLRQAMKKFFHFPLILETPKKLF